MNKGGHMPQKRDIRQYEHKSKKRVNNPPVGLVTPQTDPPQVEARKTSAYNPHLVAQRLGAVKCSCQKGWQR